MTDADHCFPLSIDLSACCFHTSIIAKKDTETYWSSKKLKTSLLKEHKTLKNIENQEIPPKKEARQSTVSPSSYNHHVVTCAVFSCLLTVHSFYPQGTIAG